MQQLKSLKEYKMEKIVKRAIIAVIIVVVLLMASSLTSKAFAKDKGYVNYDFLNVRQFATTDAKIVKRLYYGDVVNIGIHKDGFGKIKKGQWVCLDYITFLKKYNEWYCDSNNTWIFRNLKTNKVYKGYGWRNAWLMAKTTGSRTSYFIATDKNRGKTYVLKKVDGVWYPWKCSNNVIGVNASTCSGIYEIYKKTPSFKVDNLSGIPTECLYACWFKGHKSLHSPTVYKGTKRIVSGKGVKGVKGIKGVKGVKGAKGNGTTGCIRLSMSLSKWIYKNCPVGTRVMNY